MNYLLFMGPIFAIIFFFSANLLFYISSKNGTMSYVSYENNVKETFLVWFALNIPLLNIIVLFGLIADTVALYRRKIKIEKRKYV